MRLVLMLLYNLLPRQHINVRLFYSAWCCLGNGLLLFLPGEWPCILLSTQCVNNHTPPGRDITTLLVVIRFCDLLWCNDSKNHDMFAACLYHLLFRAGVNSSWDHTIKINIEKHVYRMFMYIVRLTLLCSWQACNILQLQPLTIMLNLEGESCFCCILFDNNVSSIIVSNVYSILGDVRVQMRVWHLTYLIKSLLALGFLGRGSI